MLVLILFPGLHSLFFDSFFDKPETPRTGPCRNKGFSYLYRVLGSSTLVKLEYAVDH